MTAKRETGADILVVIMSGSFTLRGDICVADKFQRAQWAIDNGADIVLELPTIYTLSNAKTFAYGALKTLSMLGDFTLSFGTEADEIENLCVAAEFLASESKDMSRLLKSFLNEGFSVAKSRTMALDILRPDIANMIQDPNNILAVEYLKAGKEYGDKVHFHSVNRLPDDNKKYLSSTKIRERMFADLDYSKFVPKNIVIDRKVDLKKYSAISTYALKSTPVEELKTLQNISEGFENKIAKSDFNNFLEFLELTTKRYTKSTVKRIAAATVIGLKKEHLTLALNEQPYCTVLAFRPNKKKVLFPILANADGYFYFKASDCEPNSPVKSLVDLDQKAHKILTICLEDNE